MKIYYQFLAAAMVCLTLQTEAASAATLREVDTLQQSNAVFQQVMSTPGKGIPAQLLSDAQAVAVVPQVKGGAFIVGIRRGHGVLVARDQNGQWTMPQFIELTGGSVGWQAGIQSTDVILVFRSRESLANLMRGKLTIGADASAAAGPVGRQVSAATDVRLNSEIYSYSRSRGAFLGVSLDGSVLKPNPQADAGFYQQPAPGAPANTGLQLATQLVGLIAQYAGGPALSTVAAPATSAAPSAVDTFERPLQESWQRLEALLAPEWKQFLALPTSATTADMGQYHQAISFTMQRYESIAANPHYAQLTSRPEFQTVYSLLRHAVQSQNEAAASQLQLPPPPTPGQTGSLQLAPQQQR